MSLNPESANPLPNVLLIGARGWEHETWTGLFYPDDMPREWRLVYYANEFRTVLVPGDTWERVSPEQVSQWREDVGEGFVFFLEPPPGLSAPRVQESFVRQARALDGYIGGIVLSVPAGTARSRSEWEAWLARLPGDYPVFVDAREGVPPAEVMELFAAHGVTLCWDSRAAPGVQATRFGIIRAADGSGDPRALRGRVQAFVQRAPAGETAALVFEGDPPSIQILRDAVVIARLLGV